MNAVLGHYDIGCSVWIYKEKDFGLTGAQYAPIKNDLISLWTTSVMICNKIITPGR